MSPGRIWAKGSVAPAAVTRVSEGTVRRTTRSAMPTPAMTSTVRPLVSTVRTVP
jgi:hypothetical protein